MTDNKVAEIATQSITDEAQSQEDSLYNDTQLTNSEKVQIILTENADNLLLPYLDERYQFNTQSISHYFKI